MDLLLNISLYGKKIGQIILNKTMQENPVGCKAHFRSKNPLITESAFKLKAPFNFKNLISKTVGKCVEFCFPPFSVRRSLRPIADAEYVAVLLDWSLPARPWACPRTLRSGTHDQLFPLLIPPSSNFPHPCLGTPSGHMPCPSPPSSGMKAHPISNPRICR